MAVIAKQNQVLAECKEYKVTVPSGGHSVNLAADSQPGSRLWRWLCAVCLTVKLNVWGLMKKVWSIRVSEPRKVIHCLKVGLALTLVSLLYYVRPLYDGTGGTAMGSVLTVVVVFEFTVGGTVYKAFNRVSATLLAGSLAISIHFIAERFRNEAELAIRGASLFLIALVATYARFIPDFKKRYDYGLMTFIVTFALVSVSGYRVNKLLDLAQNRCSTVIMGSSICMLISTFINPVWAGDDLHVLIIRNMEKLSESLHGCVVEYFSEGGIGDGKEEWCQRVHGYECILSSKPLEDSLANLARWEPARGCFSFRHPWKQYVKVGSAMRKCACCIECLQAYMSSKTQIQVDKASEHMKKHLRMAFIGLSIQSSIIMKELADSTKRFRKSSAVNFLIEEMNNTVGDLQLVLKSLPNQPSLVAEADSEMKMQQQLPSISNSPVLEALPLVTIASLLIRIATTVEGVAAAANDLAGSLFCEIAQKGERKEAIETVH